MPKTTHRLTAISASNIKKPGLYPDGAGLYLRVKPSGARSWVFRYMHDCKPRYLGLGSA
ncbi:MAG TPA: Arm DNA-binding domain-containing protein, partial [Hyphomicrobium sp.]|uniref:Arm DNA-binding domain-containing protein n=1 Tax=Hyphomicrobium sp. TaxID=82 RepID=UPI002CEFD3A9